jgi:hypothetical protein
MVYKSTKHTVITDAKEVLRKRMTNTERDRLREKLARKQDYICPICTRDMKKLRLIMTLDHCHSTGHPRGVLCNNCNGLEGKLANILTRIDISKIGTDALLQNLANHRNPKNLKRKYIHPNVETLKEKRDRQNARARKLYKEKKQLESGKMPTPKRKSRKRTKPIGEA